MNASRCILQVPFTPEAKYNTQRFLFHGWDKLKAVHLDRISTDALQSSYFGLVSVSLRVDNDQTINIMNTVCILQPPSSTDDHSKLITRDQPGVPFDLMQRTFEPRVTCIADSASIQSAVAASGVDIGTGKHDIRFCVDISPAPDTGDSLIVYLRLEF